jgi:hypothetical protein
MPPVQCGARGGLTEFRIGATLSTMRETRIELIDDRDGSPADETLDFALDGINYQIDLSEKNASELRELLLPYTSVAHRTGRGAAQQVRVGGGSRPARSAADRERLSAIRQWGKANGYAISDRGRIPQDLVEAFDAAQNAPAVAAAPPAKRSRRAKPKAAPEFSDGG